MLADHHELSLAGARAGRKIIVADPRITPIARTCDLYLPVKPGRDAALFAGVLQLMIEHDWIDHAFIEAHTTGFDEVAAYCWQWTLARTREVTGVPERSLDAGRGMVGHGAERSFLFHARGIEHHSNGVQNSLGTINLVLASGRIGKPKSGYGTIVGQANGQGGREHGQKCDQLPGWRDISNPEHRKYIAGVWGIDETELPRARAWTRTRCSARSTRARSRDCSSICFNPKVSLPDNSFITRCLDKLEFFVVIDFFLSETARHADIVLPGSLHEEDEGTVTQVEGRVIKINKAVDCPGRRNRTGASSRTSPRASAGRRGSPSYPREIFEELRIASKGGVADYSGITYEKIERQMGVFWPCYSEDPRTGKQRRSCRHAAAVRAGKLQPCRQRRGPFYFPDGKARFNVADYRPPADDVDAEYPLFLTTGRVVSQFLSGTQTRRIGPLVKQYPEPRIEMHPRLAEKLGMHDGEWTIGETRRGSMTLKAHGGDDHSARHGLHSRTTGRDRRARTS